MIAKGLLLLLFMVSWVAMPIIHCMYPAPYWTALVDMTLWYSVGVIWYRLDCCAMKID